MNATCGPDGANPTARRPEHRDWCSSTRRSSRPRPLRPWATGGDHVRLVPPVGRDGRRTEHARQAGDRGHASFRPCPTAPRKASVSEPVWTSIRPGPPRPSTSAGPGGGRGRAALPSAGTDRSERSGPVRREERDAAAVRGPVQVERGVESRSGRRRPSVADPAAHRPRTRRSPPCPAWWRSPPPGTVGRPGREPERRAGRVAWSTRWPPCAVDDREAAVRVRRTRRAAAACAGRADAPGTATRTATPRPRRPRGARPGRPRRSAAAGAGRGRAGRRPARGSPRRRAPLRVSCG